MKERTNQQIGNYKIEYIIRADNLFSLFKATEIPTSKDCFLEILFPDKICSDEFISKFLSRADLLSIIEHDDLLNIIGYGQDDGECFLVYEYFQGVFLSDRKEFSLSENEVALLLSQAVEGLSFLHQQGILHGFLSLENILIDHNKKPKLLNFGLIDLINQEAMAMLPENAIGIGYGTPGYLAPEQLLGQALSKRTDVYAIGALYYKLLTGQQPYFATTSAETIFKQISSNLEWLDTPKKSYSRTSIHFIYRCLAKSPNDRFNSMEMAQKFLKKIAAGKHPFIPIKQKILAGAPPNKLRRIWITLSSTVLLCLIISTYFFIYHPLASVNLSSLLFNKNSGTTGLHPTNSPLQETLSPSESLNAKSTSIPQNIITKELTPSPTSIHFPILANTQIPRNLETISLENVNSIQELSRIGGGKLIQAAWAPDNKTIAIASTAGVTIINNGEIIQFLDPKDSATSVAFSLDGDILAIGINRGDIQLWDWRNQVLQDTFKGHSSRVSKIIFSKNLRYLVSASYDLNIKIWDLASKTEIRNIPAHPYPIKDISLSDDGRFLVSGAADHIVKVWDFFSGEKITEFRHSSSINAVAVSPDGTFVASGGDNGEINQWNISSKQLRGDPIPVESQIWSLYYNQDGNNLWVGLDDGDYKNVSALPEKYLWEKRQIDKDKIKLKIFEMAEIYGAGFELSSNMTVSPDFSSVFTINWSGVVSRDKGYESCLPVCYDDFYRIAFSPDSRYLLIGGKNDYYLLLDTLNNQVITKNIAMVPPGAPFSPTSDNFVIIEKKYLNRSYGRVAVYEEYANLKSIATEKMTSIEKVPIGSTVQFIKEGTLLVTGTIAQTRMWDTLSQKEVYLTRGSDSGCLITRSSNNGEILSITSSHGMLSVWDELTQKICSLSFLHRNSIGAFSFDRKWFGFINENGLLEVVNLETNQSTIKKLLDQKVTALAFSHDSSLLLVGFDNGKISAWSPVNGTQLRSLTGHFGPVRAIVFASSDKMVASSSSDGTTRIWGVLSK